MMDRLIKDREWYATQLAAGRDIKHIADYLQVPKSEVELILKIHGLIENTPPHHQIKRDVAPPVTYNLNDTPKGRAELDRLRDPETAKKNYIRSAAHALQKKEK